VDRVSGEPAHCSHISQGEIIMAKFMIMGAYTADGAKGLLKDGGSRRKSAVEQMVSNLGGKLEAFYFAFGESDIFAIVDVPDTTSGAALSLAVNASGTVKLRTVMLVTPEELDAACKKTVSYRPPGQ
jgi:uncharacterized protein with GYD domain